MNITQNAKFVLAAMRRHPFAALATALATSAYCYVVYYQAKNITQIIEDWRGYNYKFSAYAEAPDSFASETEFCPVSELLSALPICHLSDDPTVLLQKALNKGQNALYKYFAIMNAKPLLIQLIDHGLTYIFTSYINFKWLGIGMHAELGMKYVSQPEKTPTLNILDHAETYATGIRAALLLSINCINAGMAAYQFYQQKQLYWVDNNFDILKYACYTSTSFIALNLAFNHVKMYLSKKEIVLHDRQINLLAFNTQNPLQVEVNQATASEHTQLQYNIYSHLVNDLLLACTSIARTISNVIFQEVTYINVLSHSIPTIIQQPNLFKNIRKFTDQFGLAIDELSGVINTVVNLSEARQAATQVMLFDECTTKYQTLIKNRKLSIIKNNKNISCDFSVTYPGQAKLFDVQYEFKRGNIYALSGDSGAGKSSFFNSLFGVNPYCAGQINVPNQENFIYISQNIALKPELNFLDTLLYPQKFTDFAAAEQDIITKLVTGLAQDFDMTNKMLHAQGNWIGNLSGGEVQRFAAMQAIVKMVLKCKKATEHVVLLMDEGLNALNPEMKETVFKTLCSYIKECNATCIAIDHGDAKELRRMYGEDFTIDFNRFSCKTNCTSMQR